MKNSMRLSREIGLALVMGYFLQVYSPSGPVSVGCSSDQVALVVILAFCFVLGWISRTLLIRKRYPSLEKQDFPCLYGAFCSPFWAQRGPLQDEISMALHGVAFGSAALVIDVLLNCELSLIGMVLVPFATGDFFATRAFWRKNLKSV